MAENPAPTQAPMQAGMSQGNALNERTYQEVEYLKKNLGPILVAALAEICIRRPADPIEYLGHWLLRWRYNEELKRRDVQNALEVVRRKTWDGGKEEALPNPNAPAVPPAPQSFAEGFVPSNPYAPPGYGGPLSGEQLAAAAGGGSGTAAALGAAPDAAAAPGGEVADSSAPLADQAKRGSGGSGGALGGQEKRKSGDGGGSATEQEKRKSVGGSGSQEKRKSVGAEQEKRKSDAGAPPQ